MKLVVDANIVFSAIVRSSRTRELLFYPSLELYSPESLFEELEEHKPEILQKSGLQEKEFYVFLSAFRKIIEVVPKTAYSEYLTEAGAVIDDIDDLPFAALAIALNANQGGLGGGDCDIWSGDKDFLRKEGELFRKFGVKVFTTQRLFELMKK